MNFSRVEGYGSGIVSRVKQMIGRFLLSGFLLLIIGCGSEPIGVPVGFSTSLRLNPKSKVKMTPDKIRFFVELLQIDPMNHFSGHQFETYDTLYASTLKNLRTVNMRIADLIPEDAKIMDSDSGNVISILYSRSGWYVYRLVIPEQAYHQLVILDAAGRDSVKIAGYYQDNLTAKLIK